MSVQNLWVDGQKTAGSQAVRGSSDSADGMTDLLRIAAVCNAAKFLQTEGQHHTRQDDSNKDTREILGDASESALLRYCESICPVQRMRDEHPKLYDLPFNSTNKFALCLVNLKDKPNKQLVMMKGAPEIILARCSTWLKEGTPTSIDDDFKKQFQDAYEHFAGNGERVLGFAQLEIDVLSEAEILSGDVPQQSLTFVGLISLLDPPKPGVDKAVLDCHSAGIKVFMVTGDHALTAEAIARQVNIITKKTRKNIAEQRGVSIDAVHEHDPEIEAVVVTGHELNKFTEDNWKWLLDHAQIVFARTTPQQKLEIVERLQERGEVIAVTGDGVNDSPALKKADVVFRWVVRLLLMWLEKLLISSSWMMTFAQSCKVFVRAVWSLTT
jgi:sodium/potassium-transporting ATPase subunit alpha